MQVGGTMKGRTDHTGLRLTVETSIFVLLAGGWLWGVLALGAHAMATQGPTSHGEGLSGRGVLSCPAVPHGPGEGVGGEVCRPELRPHAGTSRQPGRAPVTMTGVALENRRMHIRDTADRILEKPHSGRSS